LEPSTNTRSMKVGRSKIGILRLSTNACTCTLILLRVSYHILFKGVLPLYPPRVPASEPEAGFQPKRVLQSRRTLSNDTEPRCMNPRRLDCGTTTGGKRPKATATEIASSAPLDVYFIAFSPLYPALGGRRPFQHIPVAAVPVSHRSFAIGEPL